MGQDIISDGINQIMNAKRSSKDSVKVKKYSKLLLNILAIGKLKNYVTVQLPLPSGCLSSWLHRPLGIPQRKYPYFSQTFYENELHCNRDDTDPPHSPCYEVRAKTYSGSSRSVFRAVE